LNIQEFLSQKRRI